MSNKNNMLDSKRKRTMIKLKLSLSFVFIGMVLGVSARYIAIEEYEICGAWYTVGYWLLLGIILLTIIGLRKSNVLATLCDIKTIIIVQLTTLVIGEFLSWTMFPNLLVTARLSTAPLAAFLCAIALGTILFNEYSSSRIVIAILIPIMIFGRFSFHVLGGAPPVVGITVYEIRCMSELLIPITTLTLLSSFECSERDLLRIRARYTNAVCIEKGEYIVRHIELTKGLQIILCTLSLIFSIYSFQIGDYLLLIVLLVVPLIIIVSGKRTDKYLVSFAVLIKLVYDFSAGSFVKESYFFILYIAMDILALALALLGYQAAYYLINKIQIISLILELVLYSCSTVARDNYVFYRTVSIYTSEILLYESYALFSVWGKWASSDPVHFFKSIINTEINEASEEWLSIENIRK